MSIETCEVCKGQVNTDQSVMAFDGTKDIFYHLECHSLRPCYVCQVAINTAHETNFSSTSRRGALEFFHLNCAREDDPKTFDEFLSDVGRVQSA